MKLSAILEPMIAAGVPGDVILATVKAFEEQQTDALERRRANDRERQERRRHVKSRDVTVTVPSHDASVARGEDNLQTKVISGQKDLDTSPSARSKKGERISDDFEPDTEWAQAQGLSPSEASVEAAQFVDFWRSKPGKDGIKLDWPATWRMWVRNAIKRHRSPPRQSTSPPPGRKLNYGDLARQRIMGEQDGSEGVFGPFSDAERLPGEQERPGTHDVHLRGGIERRVVSGSA